MAKSKLRTVVITTRVVASFWEYDTEAKNRRAIASLKREVQEIASNNMVYLSIAAEKDSDGDYHDDCTRATRISVTVTEPRNTTSKRTK
jgi:hypothetical protein